MKFSEAFTVVGQLCSFTTKADIGSQIVDLANKQAEWSQATFGDDSDRGPIGPLSHLKKECDEAVKSLDEKPSKAIEEFADIFLLAIESARRAGFPLQSVIQAAVAKQIVNMHRTWLPPKSPTAICEHVREHGE